MGILESIEQFVLSTATAVYDAIGWLGVGLLMAIESTAVPLPSEIIMPLAGWLLVAEKDLGPWGLVTATLVGSLGSVIGALIEYWVAYWLGRPLIAKYGKFVLVTEADLAKTERWFSKYGVWAVFFLRLIPGVRGLAAIPAGISRMNIVVFTLSVFAAALPWNGLLAFGGYLLGESFEEISVYIRPFYIPIIVATVLAIAIFLWRRIAAIRRQETL